MYRGLLAVGSGPPRLSQLRRRVIQDEGLMLVYLFGRNGGYVLAIGPHDARLTRLEVGLADAKALGVEPGPLTTARLKQALIDGGQEGILQHLAKPAKARKAFPKLAVLWRMLVPETERKQFTGGRVKRLVVVPDGALALLPFETLVVDPADDGYLTLAEIYGLDLKGCELTILSACRTNYGPQQQGEGVWALSRGFLVAGSRRVVASNWLVDDEAAASLVSYFCGCLAAAEKEGRTADYARALLEANAGSGSRRGGEARTTGARLCSSDRTDGRAPAHSRPAPTLFALRTALPRAFCSENYLPSGVLPRVLAHFEPGPAFPTWQRIVCWTIASLVSGNDNETHGPGRLRASRHPADKRPPREQRCASARRPPVRRPRVSSPSGKPLVPSGHDGGDL